MSMLTLNGTLQNVFTTPERRTRKPARFARQR